MARLAQGGSGVADVGTDHAILPIMLRRSGFEGRIVAGDINDGPLAKARLALAIGNLVDPPATMVNAAGDYVVSFIVERFVSGKDWLQKKLAKDAANELEA